DDFRVAVAQHHGAARVPDELGGPLDHAVALALRLNLHLAGGGHLEALFRAALRLQFGHFACSLSCRWRRRCTRIATETNAPKAPVREQGCDRRLSCKRNGAATACPAGRLGSLIMQKVPLAQAAPAFSAAPGPSPSGDLQDGVRPPLWRVRPDRP